MGRGFLPGKFRTGDDLDPTDWRRQNPRFQGENVQRNLELVKLVEELAAKKGCTPAQLALAWLLAQGQDVFPIPGTTKISRLEENTGALEVALTAAELEAISLAFPPDAALGLRYPETAMRAING